MGRVGRILARDGHIGVSGQAFALLCQQRRSAARQRTAVQTAAQHQRRAAGAAQLRLDRNIEGVAHSVGIGVAANAAALRHCHWIPIAPKLHPSIRTDRRHMPEVEPLDALVEAVRAIERQQHLPRQHAIRVRAGRNLG